MSSLQKIDTFAQYQIAIRNSVNVMTPSSNQYLSPTQDKFCMMILGFTQRACTIHKIECCGKVREYPLSFIVVIVNEFPIFMKIHRIIPKGVRRHCPSFSFRHLRVSWSDACDLHVRIATILHRQCRRDACVQRV